MIDSLSIMKRWVDTSYNINEYCKGHTGAMRSLGKVEILSLLRNKNLNAGILNEIELFGEYYSLL